MEDDYITLLDVGLVCLLCLLLWSLQILQGRGSRNEKIELEYRIYPMPGRRFHWRATRKKETNGTING